MTKLELKHLAPYLPYELKIRCGEMSHPILTCADTNEFEIAIKEVLINSAYKPILCPLSYLTKEIEVNGEKFVPAEILFSVENDELQYFKDFGKIPEYWQDAIKIKPKWYDYYQVEFLFEWHFDVFGLIEKCLAIDINTIKQ